jgi:hypothetical protein
MSSADGSTDLVDKLRPIARVQQIIVFGMVMGVLIFAGMTIFIRQAGKHEEVTEFQQLLPELALLAAVPALVASWRLSQRIVRLSRTAIVQGTAGSARQQPPVDEMSKLLASLGDAGMLCGIFQTQTIVSAAILEGAAFFNATAYLLTGNAMSLVTALLLTVVIASKFTTPARLVDWIDAQLQLINEEKQFAR